MAITMPMLIFDVLVSIRTIKINDEIEETDLLKIINGIEPSIILRFPFFAIKRYICTAIIEKNGILIHFSMSAYNLYFGDMIFLHTKFNSMTELCS